MRGEEVCVIHTPSGAHYVTLQNYFSHSSLVIYFFLTLYMKLILGLEIGEKLCISISAFGIIVGGQKWWLTNLRSKFCSIGPIEEMKHSHQRPKIFFF